MNTITILGTLGIWTVLSSVVLVAAWIATLFAKKHAALRHLVWVTAFVALLVIPAVSSFVPAKYNLGTPQETPVVTEVSAFETLPENSITLSEVAIPEKPFDWTPVFSGLLLVWTIGVAAIFTKALVGIIQAQIMRRSSRLENGFDHLSEKLGLRRQWELRVSSSRRPPAAMTWGSLRPVVILPQESTTWPQGKVETVLLHELAHVRRYDSLSQLLALAICAVYWFNPLVWLAARALRSDAELAADDGVVRSGIKPSDYAAELLRLATEFGQQRQPLTHIGVSIMKQSQIETRILSLVDPANRRRGVAKLEGLSVIAFGAVAAIAMVALRPSMANAQGEQLPPSPPAISSAQAPGAAPLPPKQTSVPSPAIAPAPPTKAEIKRNARQSKRMIKTSKSGKNGAAPRVIQPPARPGSPAPLPPRASVPSEPDTAPRVVQPPARPGSPVIVPSQPGMPPPAVGSPSVIPPRDAPSPSKIGPASSGPAPAIAPSAPLQPSKTGKQKPTSKPGNARVAAKSRITLPKSSVRVQSLSTNKLRYAYKLEPNKYRGVSINSAPLKYYHGIPRYAAPLKTYYSPKKDIPPQGSSEKKNTDEQRAREEQARAKANAVKEKARADQEKARAGDERKVNSKERQSIEKQIRLSEEQVRKAEADIAKTRSGNRNISDKEQQRIEKQIRLSEEQIRKAEADVLKTRSGNRKINEQERRMIEVEAAKGLETRTRIEKEMQVTKEQIQKAEADMARMRTVEGKQKISLEERRKMEIEVSRARRNVEKSRADVQRQRSKLMSEKRSAEAQRRTAIERAKKEKARVDEKARKGGG